MSDLLVCVWDGHAFTPRTPFQKRLAAERFGEGEEVLLSVENERSMRSHRHYFAAIREMWLSLPEVFALEPWAQSPEHLRKRALIRTGFCDTSEVICSSVAEARRVAAFMDPIDPYSLVLAQGPRVVRYVARSQSVKAMGAATFAESKDAVLNWIEGRLERGEAA